MYKIISDILFRRLKLCTKADAPSLVVKGDEVVEMAEKERRLGCFVEYFAYGAVIS